MRGATRIGVCCVPVAEVSIHAPHAGRDHRAACSPSRCGSFNPRAPCGARPSIISCMSRRSSFQSTRPMRGATYHKLGRPPEISVSIHAPRVGRDQECHLRLSSKNYFNPRAPCGARRSDASLHDYCRYFNPRAPCGARRGLCRYCAMSTYFNPRAPCGARQHNNKDGKTNKKFQSTRPVWGATLNLIPMGSAIKDFNPRAPCGARHAA